MPTFMPWIRPSCQFASQEASYSNINLFKAPLWQFYYFLRSALHHHCAKARFQGQHIISYHNPSEASAVAHKTAFDSNSPPCGLAGSIWYSEESSLNTNAPFSHHQLLTLDSTYKQTQGATESQHNHTITAHLQQTQELGHNGQCGFTGCQFLSNTQIPFHPMCARVTWKEACNEL